MGNAGRKKNPEKTTATRNTFLEKSYELFSTRTIESVTMSEIARTCGYRDMTLYRYFPSKPILVVVVATWIWEQMLLKNEARRPSRDFSGMTAAEILDFHLGSYIELYRKKRDLLRFNQFFNVYILSERIDPEVLKPYRNMIERVKAGFHIMYTKAKQDHTVRTEESEEEMFSTILHLMLAAATRYAVGLVYIPENGFDAEKELEKLKTLLLLRYQAVRT